MDDPKEDLQPINLDQLYFAFGLLAIGIIFAYLAFMIEITAGWISNKMLSKSRFFYQQDIHMYYYMQSNFT